MLDDAALVAPHHSAVSGGSSNVRTANRFLRRELANARMKPPRPTGAWLVSDETSKPLPIWRGTGSSNPFPSSEESANLQFRSAAADVAAMRRAKTAAALAEAAHRLKGASRTVGAVLAQRHGLGCPFAETSQSPAARWPQAARWTLTLQLKPNPNGPGIFRLERALLADQAALVPGSPLARNG